MIIIFFKFLKDELESKSSEIEKLKAALAEAESKSTSSATPGKSLSINNHILL